MSPKDGPPAGQTLPTDPDSVIEAFKKDVDRTLLRENLRRSVAERLERLEELRRFAARVKDAGRRAARDRR
ncbi:MAG TPA: hypothetical protein VFB95_05925 [Candidatus Cryosericum sp.]|nr:hypothetical protein [Candidatus Cryosericum sp.]